MIEGAPSWRLSSVVVAVKVKEVTKAMGALFLDDGGGLTRRRWMSLWWGMKKETLITL